MAAGTSHLRNVSTNHADNVTMFQAFEWYAPSAHVHWNRLREALPQLKNIGIDNIWIPPGCKAGSNKSNGYDIYDLYDLGEFDQKGSRPTKWGAKEDLIEMMRVAQSKGIGVYWDTVLNHKASADYTETCHAVKVDPKGMKRLANSTKEISQPHEVEVWTGYNFSGRGDKHSNFKYHWYHFSGIDYDARTNTHGIFRFVGDGKPGWATDVADELGNYDYLILNDVDFSQSDVQEDIFKWGEWIGKELPLAGMRFDAIKHYSARFLERFIRHLDRTVGRNWFFVGEYWDSDIKTLGAHIKRFGGRMSLFDVQLVYNFSHASKARYCDLRTIFKGTLSRYYPENAVTFVQNHDTQETQALEAVVEPWFVPFGYALILLRANNGYPCVFYGDLYGIHGPKPRHPACGGKIPKMVLVRKLYAYGEQLDYFDEAECIGWTRAGHVNKRRGTGAGLAVVLNSKWSCWEKRMFVGKQHAGERWTDIMGWGFGEVIIDASGEGVFPVGHRSMGVWVHVNAQGRDEIDGMVFDDDIYGIENAKLDALMELLDNSPGIAEKLKI